MSQTNTEIMFVGLDIAKSSWQLHLAGQFQLLANYGQRCPTPEALLKDQTVPWQSVGAFAAGQRYQFNLKTLGPVYSAMNRRKSPCVWWSSSPYRTGTAKRASWSGASRSS